MPLHHISIFSRHINQFDHSIDTRPDNPKGFKATLNKSVCVASLKAGACKDSVDQLKLT